MTYSNIRKAEIRRDLDRNTWAGPVQVLSTYATVGTGEFVTEAIEFGAVFEGRPFFAFGVELQESSPALVDGDFPLVGGGVTEWVVKEVPDDENKTVFYVGAYVWVTVVATTPYEMLWRFSFDGTAMRNVEYFKGAADG